MNIPDKKTRDQWRNKTSLCSSEIVKLLDAVDHLEAKVAELKSKLEDADYAALELMNRLDP